MVAGQTTAGPPLTPDEIEVLSAVLFGIEGKDGSCKGFAITSLAALLFPGRQMTTHDRVLLVRAALDDSVVDRLREAFQCGDTALSSDAERKFVWMVRHRYSGEWRDVAKTIPNFTEGKGLVSFQDIQVPEEILKPKPVPKLKEVEESDAQARGGWPKTWIDRGKSKKPAVGGKPAAKRVVSESFGNIGGGQEKRAEQPLLVVSPRVVKPKTVFEYVGITPPPYGSSKPKCEKIEDHFWEEKVSLPNFFVLNCEKCDAGGQIDRHDAQQIWEQLQKAMPPKNKAA